MSDEELLNKVQEVAIILPVYAYIHGGIALSAGSFSCGWDSGQVGWIYATAKDVCENWNVSGWQQEVSKGDGQKIQAKEYGVELLKGEVKLQDDYHQGFVYRYKVSDHNGEEIDCCGGFYGYDGLQQAIAEAKHAAECNHMLTYRSHFAQLKKWIRAKVPLQYRKPLAVAL